MGWGHSSALEAAALADMAVADRLLLFHHDPRHSDDTVDGLAAEARAAPRLGRADAASEGLEISL